MRGQKITLGEMRSSGVRGLLVYCADYQRAHAGGSARIDGRTIFGRLILNRYSYVRRVADEAPISGLTGTGTRSQRPSAPYRRSRTARHSKNSSKSFLRASAAAG